MLKSKRMCKCAMVSILVSSLFLILEVNMIPQLGVVVTAVFCVVATSPPTRQAHG